MLSRIGMTFIASLMLVGASYAADSKIQPWNLPAGMVWHTESGKCKVTKMGGPFIEGCYFGRPDHPEEHAGLAFFRKCVGFRQMMPFLVADFQKNMLTFYSDPSKQDAPVRARNLGANENIEPEEFYNELPPLNGPCWPEQGTPT